MIYYSSQFLPNNTYTTLEELGKDVDLSKVVLVLDANLVIYLRDFFLDPKLFISRFPDSGILTDIRTLLKEIHQYKLDPSRINSGLGANESSRSKSDFSLNYAKYIQTEATVEYLLNQGYVSWDWLLEHKPPTPAISLQEEDYPDSMIPLLSTESEYQHHLILMYLFAIKLICLFYDAERGNLSNKEAYFELTRFMRQEVNIRSLYMQWFALHLLGGDNDFKSILFPKPKEPENRKLHKIFSGSLDLAYPTLVNQVVWQQFPKQETIPVFLTADKRLSRLHQLVQTKIMYESDQNGSYYPEVCFCEPNSRLNWSKQDYEDFEKDRAGDMDQFLHPTGIPQKTLHLLPLVESLEQELKLSMKNN